MNNLSQFPARLQAVFAATKRGVVGLVDDLLKVCPEQGLEVGWQDNQCRIRPLGAELQESIKVPLKKSVFRAMLARIAALCNERTPGSVSPYGGVGELSACSDGPMVFRVAFLNSPGEQWLEVSLLPDGRNGTGDARAREGDGQTSRS